jgi:hypothetical protein
MSDTPDDAADRTLAQALAAWRTGQADRLGAPPAFAPCGDVMRDRELYARAPESALIAWRTLTAQTRGISQIAMWGGAEPAVVADAARRRFGFHAQLAPFATPEEAMAAAKSPAAVGVLALDSRTPWWGRLLAEPRLKVFALLPETAYPTPVEALAIAQIEVEPTGADETLWVTDATGSNHAVETALSEAGFAGRWVAGAGGLKLFALAGYVQAQDPRLLSAPGRLSGVIGAAASPYEA